MTSEARKQLVPDYLSPVPETQKNREEYASLDIAKQLHLSDPSIAAVDLAKKTGLTLDHIRQLYINMQSDEKVKNITNSVYYPRRMMTRFAEETVLDWSEDTEYADRLLSGQTVASRNLEVHATRGTCDYTCNMCLWSNKEELTYRNLGLREFGLMELHDWERVFESAQGLGTKRIVFSGGGEPLLNNDLSCLISSAHDMGLKTSLYTNGLRLGRASESEWKNFLQMEQIRFSVHSPTNDIYSQIVSIPDHADALSTVVANVEELLARRDAQDSSVRVGIGFVIQSLNFHQIEGMVDFAKNLGVDFMSLRQDGAEVSCSLNESEKDHVIAQLVSVRERFNNGDFGNMYVDMSDDMTALINRLEQPTDRTRLCYSKLFRPAISPFGIVTPCDLRAEPRFSDRSYVFGNVKKQEFSDIMQSIAQRSICADCDQCMPANRTINAIITKLTRDYEAGIHYTEQPFFVPS